MRGEPGERDPIAYVPVRVRHEVPYLSQWESARLVGDFVTGRRSAAEDPKWADSGAADPREYEFWSWRTCGMACLRMVLAHRDQPVPRSVPLAEECTRAGGYVRHPDRVDGLIYRPFAEWVGDAFGIKATVHGDLPYDEIIEMVRGGGLAIISVHPWIRWPERVPPGRGGHLVLVTGAGSGHLLIHNPSGLYGQSQRHTRIGLDDLDRFYAGRGVLIHP